VFLDDEGKGRACRLAAAGRLGRDGEIAFRAVGLQGGFHGGPMQ
jgi:hypothetical protein